jgi:MFS family permease
MQEVSVAKRHFLFTMACSHVLLASGEAYGWTALRPVLIDSGFFDSFPPDQQSTMLTAVATMGIAANALCKLPLGIFLDSYGPRYTAVLGAVLLSTGSLLLALGDKQSQSMMMLGYFLLGVAGPFLQMPCFQFSELFGHRKASAMASLITCFELSTGVFWIFGQLHNMFQLDRTSLFLGYSGVGVYTLVTALLFWPDLPYRSPPPPPHPQQRTDLPGKTAPQRRSSASSSMLNRPLWQQVHPLHPASPALLCFPFARGVRALPDAPLCRGPQRRRPRRRRSRRRPPRRASGGRAGPLTRGRGRAGGAGGDRCARCRLGT